ncbi:uncharacterized protein LOC106131537 [Amyelois transitella]|uniref:uncharacterized protein LOC106134976 n=1 Tax=Amyelois transitella TaxID=680683 RepID=UPI00298F5011|nr:uncharacterized protein LOC106134976 [Amyelois transitella]XP_060805432.1 uncharacterized protein LOC106131537 [Amyelois transitella]
MLLANQIKANLGQNVKKENFAPLLKKAIEKLTPDCIKNGFRAGGLFPFGPDYIDMSKIKNREEASVIQSNPALTEFVKYLEKEIIGVFSEEKLAMFQNLFYKKRDTVESDLPEEDTALYVIWAKNKSKCYSDDCASSCNILPTSEVIESHSPSTLEPINISMDIIDHVSHSETVVAEKEVIDFGNSLTPQNYSLASVEDIREQSPIIVDSGFGGVNQNLEVEDFNTLQRVVECTPKKISTITHPPSPSILQLPSDPAVTESNGIPQPEIITTANSQWAVDNTITSSIVPENRSPFLTPDRPTRAPISRTIHTDKIAPTKKTMDDALGIIVPSPFKKFLFWPEDDINKKKKRIKREKIPAAVTSKAWREYHEKKENEKKRQQKEKEERARKRQEKKELKENNAEKKKKTISKKNKKKIPRIESSSEESSLEIEFAESDCSYAEDNISEDNDRENIINKISKSVNSERKPLKRKKPVSPTTTDSDFDIDASCSLGTLTTKKKVSKTRQTNKITSGCYVIVTYENKYFPGKVEKVENNLFEVSAMVLSMGNTFRWPEKPDKIWYRFDQIIEEIDTPVRLNNRGFYKIKEMQKYLPDIYN